LGLNRRICLQQRALSILIGTAQIRKEFSQFFASKKQHGLSNAFGGLLAPGLAKRAEVLGWGCNEGIWENLARYLVNPAVCGISIENTFVPDL
jgi:hypothetical protein